MLFKESAAVSSFSVTPDFGFSATVSVVSVAVAAGVSVVAPFATAARSVVAGVAVLVVVSAAVVAAL